jgi:hypothetical protein
MLVEIIFITTNFDTLPMAKKWPICHEFLSQDKLHVNDKCAKIQAQKAYTKNQEHPIYQRVCPPLASITACNLVGME